MASKKKVIPKTEGKVSIHHAKRIKKNSAITPSIKKRQKIASSDFPIISIDISADGLHAFEEFLQYLAAPSGMAFVLVTYLYPDRASIFYELPRKTTAPPVKQITDHNVLKKEHIYANPPAPLRTGQVW